MTERSEPLSPLDAELWSLVEAVVDGTATPSERERLEARLRAEEPARQFYVAYLDLHAQLQWRTRGESVQPLKTKQVRSEWQEALADALDALPAMPQNRRRSRPVFRLLLGSAAAASLLLAVGLIVALTAHRHTAEEEDSPDLPDAPAGSVAVLIGNKNAVWEKEMALPTETGSPLPPGRLKLKAGVVEVAFHGGGDILLEGPADFDISASDRGFLHRGKLTAKVPEGAPLFQVSMPGVVVTDRGGECGLLRDDTGLTEVHVFTGSIDADPSDQEGEPTAGMRLLENAGVRVDASRKTMTPVPLNELAFERLRPEIRIADALVRGGQYAERNFGTSARLVVKNSIPDYTEESYLRFDLANVKGKVSAATVRLVPVYVGRPLVNAAALVADNRWTETGITWNTKPASGPAFARWTVTEGQAVEFDVTRLVQEALAGDKLLSLRIYAPEERRGSYFVQYGSRRGAAGSRPELLVTLEP
jgi:hypothetical protein